MLSLSATPIPRTLQMSLAGLRDISVIETPPEGRRPVRTYVGPYDEELVGEAIKREIERGGQVFFLHNRIETLHETAERLRALVPGVRFAEAHGQMDERELEATMLAFLRGEPDCLVATTIIESGLDIPTANTLIVERADQLGLAQAYQIRGRVGRSRERAYAYMLYPSRGGADRGRGGAARDPRRPHRARLRLPDRDARPRASAAPATCSATSSRGTSPRSASSSTARCSTRPWPSALRARAGRSERAEREPVRVDVDVDAYVPADYVPFEAAKIDVHRRIAAAREPGELRALARRARATASARCRSRSRTCSPSSAPASSSAAPAPAASSSAAGRGSVAEPLELDSDRGRRAPRAGPEAIYEWREKTLTLRVAGSDAPDAERARRAASRWPTRSAKPARQACRRFASPPDDSSESGRR